MAGVYTRYGVTIAEGLQGCHICDEAIQIAISAARERGVAVELLDDDGEWIVHPDGACSLLATLDDPPEQSVLEALSIAEDVLKRPGEAVRG